MSELTDPKDPIVHPSYPGYPEPTLTRHFRNALLDFKKTFEISKDREELQLKMEHLLNTSQKVIWPHETSGVFSKDAAEKAMEKLITSFQRYLKDLEEGKSQESYSILFDALLFVELMVPELKGR